jgi:hypothetical protein
MSIARHHAEWLSLIESSGPFLSLPVLLQTFPQGLPPRQPEMMQPLRINNRVVLHLLESLQVLRVKVPGGGPAEARRLSFRGLDIEQIGHVYEGRLDHTAVRATGPVVGLQGAKNQEPELPLARLEEWQVQGEAVVLENVKAETGRSESALRRALRELDGADGHKRLLTCGQDAALLARVRPFAALLRADSFGMPVVILPLHRL